MILMLKSTVMDYERLLEDNDIEDWDSMMFYGLIECFNIIAEMVKYDKTLPYFDLKANWKLIKKHKFDYALINVQDWITLIEKEE